MNEPQERDPRHIMLDWVIVALLVVSAVAGALVAHPGWKLVDFVIAASQPSQGTAIQQVPGVTQHEGR
jgi:hypothetical protein